MDDMDLLKQIPDNSVDLVLTDPPYGIDFQSNMRVMSDKFNKLENDNNDSRFKTYKEFKRTLKNNSVCIIFCSFKNYAIDYLEIQKYFDIKNAIIWSQGGGGIGDLKHSLLTDYEIAIIAHKGKRQINGKREGSVWKINKVDPNQMYHPTEKPIKIIQKLLLQFSNESDLILDPFMGSWTTAVACKKLHRNFIGCELEEKYCDIGKQRLAQQVLI